MHQLNCDKIIGANDCLDLPIGGQLSHKCWVRRIPNSKEVLWRFETRRQEGLPSARQPSRNRRRGEGARNEQNSGNSQLDQMFARHVTSCEVVNADKVQVAARRKWHEISIEKNNSDSGSLQSLHGSLADHIHLGGEF